MGISVNYNVSSVKRAIAKYILGMPGELVALRLEDCVYINSFPLNKIVTISTLGKNLNVKVSTVVSEIETRKVWVITYLESIT